MEAQAAKQAERDVLVANEEKPETILASSFTVHHLDNSFVACIAPSAPAELANYDGSHHDSQTVRSVGREGCCPQLSLSASDRCSMHHYPYPKPVYGNSAGWQTASTALR